jgi:2-methylcitrate dehydratase PrpD
MGYTGAIADFVSRSSINGFPQEVIDMSKKCFLDWLGVTLGGTGDAVSALMVDFARETGGRRQASVLGFGMKTSLVNAALVNGTMAHVLDYDDALSVVRAHVSAPLIAALLPMAEYKRLCGRDFITAMVMGFELSTRVGLALGKGYYEAGWHATAILGRLGAAAGAGKLLGLGGDQLVMAIGLAATQAGGIRDVFGTMGKAFHAGKAAADGILAAMLAQRGVTAPTDVLDNGSGFSRVFSSNYRGDTITTNLGQTWTILNNSFKPYAACLLVHPVVDGLIQLREKYALKAAEIEEVRVEVAPLNLAVTSNPQPATGLEGKFSLSFAAALAILFGHARNTLFSDKVVHNPEVRGMMRKVAATSNSGITETEANLTVRLKGGQMYWIKVTSPKGDPRNPLSFAEIQDKFGELATSVLPENRIGKIIERVRQLEDQKDISTIVRLCCKKVKGGETYGSVNRIEKEEHSVTE